MFTSETCTSAAGSCNEDICGCVSNAARILDGATSLSRRTVLDGNGQRISDAAHFVATLSAGFHRGMGLGQDIMQALNSALRSVRQDEDILGTLDAAYGLATWILAGRVCAHRAVGTPKFCGTTTRESG